MSATKAAAKQTMATFVAYRVAASPKADGVAATKAAAKQKKATFVAY